MKNKLILLALSIFLCTLTPANVFAQEQEPMPAAERAAKLTEWMKNNLQLTAEQETQAQQINLKYANKTEELRTTKDSKMQKFKKVKAYNDSKDKELKEVFTDEQYKKYQAKKEEVKEEFKTKKKQ